MQLSRRNFLRGAGALFVAAPAIIRVSSLMPVKAFNVNEFIPYHWRAAARQRQTLANAMYGGPLQLLPGQEMTAHEVNARIEQHIATLTQRISAGFDELTGRALDRARQQLDAGEGVG